jgi:hypothetical protein
MSYDHVTHRQQTRVRLIQLIAQGGPGWHDYAREQAKELEKDDPTLHRGLLDAVQAEIEAQTRRRVVR